MADYINDAKDNITNVAGDFSKNINNSVNNLSSNVSDLYKDSSPFSNTSNSSLPDSNSILAKFAFLIFMLIFFVIIMKIMVGLITSFFKPDNTPTIVSGTILGTEGKRNFSQNPNSYGAIPILRSHNDNMGIEFTWSTWLNINQRLYQKNSNHKNSSMFLIKVKLILYQTMMVSIDRIIALEFILTQILINYLSLFPLLMMPPNPLLSPICLLINGLV